VIDPDHARERALELVHAGTPVWIVLTACLP
jgi:hypothetical protein